MVNMHSNPTVALYLLALVSSLVLPIVAANEKESLNRPKKRLVSPRLGIPLTTLRDLSAGYGLGDNIYAGGSYSMPSRLEQIGNGPGPPGRNPGDDPFESSRSPFSPSRTGLPIATPFPLLNATLKFKPPPSLWDVLPPEARQYQEEYPICFRWLVEQELERYTDEELSEEAMESSITSAARATQSRNSLSPSEDAVMLSRISAYLSVARTKASTPTRSRQGAQMTTSATTTGRPSSTDYVERMLREVYSANVELARSSIGSYTVENYRTVCTAFGGATVSTTTFAVIREVAATSTTELPPPSSRPSSTTSSPPPPSPSSSGDSTTTTPTTASAEQVTATCTSGTAVIGAVPTCGSDKTKISAAVSAVVFVLAVGSMWLY